MEWISIKDRLPENNVVVNTKVDDLMGERNIGRLKRYNNLWFVPDGRMYVYFTPTHWMPLSEHYKR